MATPAAASIEFEHCPQTPQSNKSIHFHTPGANAAQNVKENVSTPKRKLFNTLKSLSARGKSRTEYDVLVQKSPLERKSAWDLFGRRIQQESSSDHQEFQVESPQSGTHRAQNSIPENACELGGGAPSRTVSRRKSLSDVFHTFSRKVSVKSLSRKATAKYSTISLYKGRLREFPTTDGNLQDPFGPLDRMAQHEFLTGPQPNCAQIDDGYTAEARSDKNLIEHVDCVDEDDNAVDDIEDNAEREIEYEAQNYVEHPAGSPFSEVPTLPILSYHLPSLPNLDADRELEQMVDSFQTAQTQQLLNTMSDSDSSSEWSGSQAETLLEKEDTPNNDGGLRPGTPDDYLRALIEAHCPSGGVYAAYSADQEELSPYPSPHKYQPTSAIDFLEDDCSVHQTLDSSDEKTHVRTNSGTIFCLGKKPLEPSTYRDHRIATVCEVPPGSQREEEAMANKQTGEDPIDVGIRMTLAKMTKNYHAYGSDDLTFEESQKEVWDAIIMGDQVLHKTTPPMQTRRISSLEDDCVRYPSGNKILEDTISLRSPTENLEFIRTTSPSASAETAQSQDTTSRVQKSYGSAVEASTQPEVGQIRFVELGSLKRLGEQARIPLNPYTKCPGPFRLDIPQVGDQSAKTFTSEYRSQTISKWREQNRTGRYAKFCIYNERSQTYTLRPRWESAPSSEDLRKSECKILWLSRHDQAKPFDFRVSKYLTPTPGPGKKRKTDVKRSPLLDHEDCKPEDIRKYYTKKLTGLSRDDQNNNETVSGEEDLWKQATLGTNRRNSYDVETAFLRMNPSPIKPQGSSLANEAATANEEVAGSLSDVISTADMAAGSEFTRSFFGSQFPGSNCPSISADDSMRIFKELMTEENNGEILVEPIRSEEPLVSRTWFDLAKSYKTAHPDAKKSEEDHLTIPIEPEGFQTARSWFGLDKISKDLPRQVGEGQGLYQQPLLGHQDGIVLQRSLPQVNRSTCSIGVYRDGLSRVSEAPSIEHIENTEIGRSSTIASVLPSTQQEPRIAVTGFRNQTAPELSKYPCQASSKSWNSHIVQEQTAPVMYYRDNERPQSPDPRSHSMSLEADGRTRLSRVTPTKMYPDFNTQSRGPNAEMDWATSGMYHEAYNQFPSSKAAPQSTFSEVAGQTAISQAKAETPTSDIYPEVYGRSRKSYVEAEKTIRSMYQEVYGRGRQEDITLSQEFAGEPVLAPKSAAPFALEFEPTAFPKQMKERIEKVNEPPQRTPIVDACERQEPHLKEMVTIQAPMMGELNTSRKHQHPPPKRQSVKGLANIFQAHGFIPARIPPCERSLSSKISQAHGFIPSRIPPYERSPRPPKISLPPSSSSMVPYAVDFSPQSSPMCIPPRDNLTSFFRSEQRDRIISPVPRGRRVVDVQGLAPTPKTQIPMGLDNLDVTYTTLVLTSHNSVPTVQNPVSKREGSLLSSRPGLKAGMRSEARSADTVVTDSSFGEILERCGSRGAKSPEHIIEERKIRNGELHGYETG